MSSVLALNVTPKKHIFLFLTLPFSKSKTRFNNNVDLFLLDLITLWIMDKFVLNFKKIVQNKKFIIFDMRNIYSSIKMKKKKIKYFAIGR